MAYRIEIGLRRGVRDARGEGVAAKARGFLHLPVSSCATRDVYLVDVDLKAGELRRVSKAFADPVINRVAIDRLPPPAFDWMIEVEFKPGVTDNVGRTAAVVVADVLDRPLSDLEGVYTGVQYFIRGQNLRQEDAQRLGRDVLANELIQTIKVCSSDEWAARPVDSDPPVIREATDILIQTFDLSGSDADLMKISRDGILSLSIEEMHAIRDYFRRPDIMQARAALGLPEQLTDVELECVAQTWSEHCKHKIFSARVRYVDENGREEWVDSLFKTYIRGTTEQLSSETDNLVSVFSDNAGIIRFNERYNIAYKVETHNSPSALDPYGGAITGIVGVNRDPMGTGMGCEMLCNVWGYCLGSPFYDGEVPAGLMHPRRIRDGVHHGVIDGGNQSGIPWMRGFERFDDRYIGKPLVYCGTVGRIPCHLQGRPSERKEVFPGDRVVMCGGRIGKDGIHGATFSSEELRHESPAQAVQIGDAVTQRKMYEFLMEARDLGLYRALTDNGAGGLSSSIGEMSRLSGGAELDLSKAPLKYAGLQPWEILLSEAQERMSLAVPPEQVDAFLALACRRDVEAVVLGRFTDSGAFVVRHGDRTVGRLDMEFLHDGCPRMTIDARWSPPSIPAPARPRAGTRGKTVLRLLGALNVCSREYKSRMYDGEVKGLSVVKPFVGVGCDVPSDATVMRVEYGSNEGLVLSEGINPFYSDLDTYHMMAGMVDEAVRRAIGVGARPDRLAGLDNFCWPDPVWSEKTPDGPYKMAQLVRANRALYDTCIAYKAPLISGKDSMKNDSVRGGRKISIPPTVLFSVIGKMDDVRQAVTMSFKEAGDAIFAIGETHAELGASEYHRLLAADQGTPQSYGGQVPVVRAEKASAIYRAVHEAIQRGLLRSCHTPTLGGWSVAAALASVGGRLGASIDLDAAPGADGLSADEKLFSESHSRFLVTCAPEKAGELEALFVGLACRRVGVVNAEAELNLTAGGKSLVKLQVNDMRKAFVKTLMGI